MASLGPAVVDPLGVTLTQMDHLSWDITALVWQTGVVGPPC